MRKLLWAFGGLAALVVFGVACNFVLDKSLGDYSGECKFEGRETACGQCIAASCTPQLNAVCVNQYDTNLSAVEECARDPNAGGYYDNYPCDRFKVDGGAAPEDNRQNLSVCIRDSCIVPQGGPCKPACAMAGDGGVSARCAACMNDNCAQEMSPIRDTRSDRGLFDKAQGCVDDPSVGEYGSYDCSPFRTEDGGPIVGSTIETVEHNFKVCVRDQCMNGAIAACKSCPLKSPDGYELGASKCGACILSSCEEPLMACCAGPEPSVSGQQLVHKMVASCGHPEIMAAECQAILAIDAGADAGCVFDLPHCIQASCSEACAGN